MEQISVDYLRKQMAEEIESCYTIGTPQEIFTLIDFCSTCDGLRDFSDAYQKAELKPFCEKIKEE